MNFAALLLVSTVIPAQPTAAQPVTVQLARVAAPAGDFDHRAWEERLATKDLDTRERDFAALVEEATANDAAREALRAWSTDAGRPDLAWTARLALREVERRPGTHLRALKNFGGGAMGDLRSRFDELESRFGGLDSMFGDLQRDLDRMFQQDEPRTGATPQPGAAPRAGMHAQSESFRMQSGPDGVEVHVDENVNGETKTRTYKARTMEELLEANPELKDRIGAGGSMPLFGSRQPQGFSFRGPFGGGTAPKTLVMPDEYDRWTTPAKPLAPSMSGKTRTDILGVLYTKPSEEVRERRNLDDGVGLEVERTEPGTIASALGVQNGDVLIALNGRALKDRADVVAALKERKDGEPVKLELVDAKGRRHTLTWNES